MCYLKFLSFRNDILRPSGKEDPFLARLILEKIVRYSNPKSEVWGICGDEWTTDGSVVFFCSENGPMEPLLK